MFSVAVIAVITVYDVWTIGWRGYRTTISWMFKVQSRRFPIIAFLGGLVSGHLWWDNTPPDLLERCNEEGDHGQQTE